jgi:hypothetical protein
LELNVIKQYGNYLAVCPQEKVDEWMSDLMRKMTVESLVRKPEEGEVEVIEWQESTSRSRSREDARHPFPRNLNLCFNSGSMADLITFLIFVSKEKRKICFSGNKTNEWFVRLGGISTAHRLRNLPI